MTSNSRVLVRGWGGGVGGGLKSKSSTPMEFNASFCLVASDRIQSQG